ncbi:pyridoxamine 5'-phosphate oxidase [Acetobacter fabarum]|jgi:pyridoxamine 5'-phosphate oxidase|uniref:pyridoxamine 5'-phosphate oxidase n=1 Tax=Acetobacter fabarum TaxID=483199 RepID=UPI00140545B8|nr:pyridoxamine 5'-phosphate oxidase [Acetobacter fabarum]MCH4026740.1 pyridoxamine 5'-phosphate oxidase [Acetobacter fabarum]MCH4056197.1 pyridoxamine 5'-phosphate oxidase [Acetobacter fabarum]MCH4085399.1 pyridoxamine 5'-phosphate oxidase [Acetobacter fabarum]MCH4127057.1 pyridoxamine 5'-phosphate oxidase [Acetobacter fabarum]MCH4137358.1 pyridoxamine 5'-phosphate oxidase [Acetobacter fabarum]
MPETDPAAPTVPFVDHPLIDLSADPFALFDAWMQDAEKSEPCDPNAMVLATATADGRPSARIVLLKGHDHRGFVFYTNMFSRKGRELEANPSAALLFHWKSLRRQIRIEGNITPVSPEEADAYFASRSRMSQLGAIASDQSRPLADRDIFEQRLKNAEKEFGNGPIPRPTNWSGYRVSPQHFEFWQERPYRLHDRAIWEHHGNGWDVTRLYP